MSTEWTLIRTQGPATLPATIAEAKQKLRLSGNHHDSELSRQLFAATEHFEQDCDRAIITQQYALQRDFFPSGREPITVSVKPVQSIDSIVYEDSDGDPQTLDSSVYTFDQGRREIALNPGQDWPTTNRKRNNVKVALTAGYGIAANVPREIIEAVLCWTAYLFYGNAPEAQQYRVAYDSMVVPNLRTSYF